MSIKRKWNGSSIPKIEVETMTKEKFLEQLKIDIPIDSKIENPGGGVSMIVSIGEDKLSYIRGTSRIYLPIETVLDVLNEFSGKTLSSSDLKEYNPTVFDSKHGGHDCNRTVTFCIFEKMGLTVGSVKGSGKRGSPFYITMV